MKYELVRLADLSGLKCSIYSVYVEEYGQTLFERFVVEWMDNYPDEVQNILDRLEAIATRTGARLSFFKEHEGKAGDLVCALYDTPDKNLRLYCIHYDSMLILLGGGGPKQVAAWQEDEKLKEEAEWMIEVSAAIYERQRNGDIQFTADRTNFLGDLTFGDDEEDE